MWCSCQKAVDFRSGVKEIFKSLDDVEDPSLYLPEHCDEPNEQCGSKAGTVDAKNSFW